MKFEKEFEFWFQGEVIGNHDGDTITLKIDRGMRTYTEDSLRLLGINTPELSEPGGHAARDFLRSICPKGTQVRIRTYKNKNDKYGRWLGVVYIAGQNGSMTCVNDLMITNGHDKLTKL